MQKRRSKADWITLIQAQQQSGLTPPLFCEREKLKLQTFYARRCDLRDKCDSTSPFIKVNTVPTATKPSSTLVLTWGLVSLSVPLDCDPEWLAQLLKALFS
jgi:putative transposase